MCQACLSTCLVPDVGPEVFVHSLSRSAFVTVTVTVSVSADEALFDLSFVWLRVVGRYLYFISCLRDA